VTSRLCKSSPPNPTPTLLPPGGSSRNTPISWALISASRDSKRGKRLGRELVEAIITEAKAIGYKKMRLDSLKSLKEAAGLYRSLGFVEIPAYRFNPLPEAVFMELGL
jgi:GNAT superfamily N-acetyltransferase